MIPDKPPKEDVFHGSEDLKKEAHISSFEKYKELYLKSIENPDGTCPFIESQSINQSSVRWRSFSEEVHLPHVTSRHHLAVKYCVRNHAFRFEQQYKQNITQLQKHLEQTQSLSHDTDLCFTSAFGCPHKSVQHYLCSISVESQ